MMKINNNRPKKTWQFTPKNNPAGRDLVKVEKMSKLVNNQGGSEYNGKTPL